MLRRFEDTGAGDEASSRSNDGQCQLHGRPCAIQALSNLQGFRSGTVGGDPGALGDRAHVASVRTDQRGTPVRDELDYWNGPIPWASPKDMKRRSLDCTEETITERGRRDAGLKLIFPPAVLFVVRGMILAQSFPIAVSTVPLISIKT